MSDEKMRAEFEAAYRAQAVERYGDEPGGAVFNYHCGEYVLGYVQSAWWGWQASRAALVIKLPPPLDADEIDDDLFGPVEIADGVNEIIARCRTAVEAAGVRVKP